MKILGVSPLVFVWVIGMWVFAVLAYALAAVGSISDVFATRVIALMILNTVTLNFFIKD